VIFTRNADTDGAYHITKIPVKRRSDDEEENVKISASWAANDGHSMAVLTGPWIQDDGFAVNDEMAAACRDKYNRYTGPGEKRNHDG
jgi:hypothetical protein